MSKAGRPRLLLPWLISVVLALVAACGAGTNDVVEDLRARNEGLSRVRLFQSLPDLLPNRTYILENGKSFTLTQAVVLGTFGDVEPGRAYSAVESPSRVQVPFDSDDAAWKTFHAHVTVSEVIGGDTVAADQTVGLALSPGRDAGGVEAALRELGSVVLFLQTSPVFAYSPGTLGIVADGELLGQVDADGGISFPVIESDEGVPFWARGATVASLTEEARGPQRQRQLDSAGLTVVSETVVP